MKLPMNALIKNKIYRFEGIGPASDIYIGRIKSFKLNTGNDRVKAFTWCFDTRSCVMGNRPNAVAANEGDFMDSIYDAHLPTQDEIDGFLVLESNLEKRNKVTHTKHAGQELSSPKENITLEQPDIPVIGDIITVYYENNTFTRIMKVTKDVDVKSSGLMTARGIYVNNDGRYDTAGNIVIWRKSGMSHFENASPDNKTWLNYCINMDRWVAKPLALGAQKEEPTIKPKLGDVIMVKYPKQHIENRLLKIKVKPEFRKDKWWAKGKFISSRRRLEAVDCLIWDRGSEINYEFATIEQKEWVEHCIDINEYIDMEDVKESITLEKSYGGIPSGVNFPSGGWCKEPSEELIKFLMKKFEGSSHKKGTHGVAWNAHSYWKIDTKSSYPTFTVSDLKQWVELPKKETMLKYKKDQRMVVTSSRTIFSKGDKVVITKVDPSSTKLKYYCKGEIQGMSFWCEEGQIKPYVVPPQVFSEGDTVKVKQHITHAFHDGERCRVYAVGNHGINAGKYHLLSLDQPGYALQWVDPNEMVLIGSGEPSPEFTIREKRKVSPEETQIPSYPHAPRKRYKFEQYDSIQVGDICRPVRMDHSHGCSSMEAMFGGEYPALTNTRGGSVLLGSWNWNYKDIELVRKNDDGAPILDDGTGKGLEEAMMDIPIPSSSAIDDRKVFNVGDNVRIIAKSFAGTIEYVGWVVKVVSHGGINCTVALECPRRGTTHMYVQTDTLRRSNSPITTSTSQLRRESQDKIEERRGLGLVQQIQDRGESIAYGSPGHMSDSIMAMGMAMHASVGVPESRGGMQQPGKHGKGFKLKFDGDIIQRVASKAELEEELGVKIRGAPPKKYREIPVAVPKRNKGLIEPLDTIPDRTIK